jgi:hypothetical protein
LTDTEPAEFWDVFWEGDFEKNGKRRFVEHYDEVRALVPKKNLLEYRIGQGWQPLCDFLEVPLPANKQFPHVNDSDGFVERCRRRNRAQMMNALVRMVLVGSGLTAIVLGAGVTVNRLYGNAVSIT